ncbi:pentapeptide repeat-containing protein [Actinokineospora sp. NPDC004072]
MTSSPVPQPERPPAPMKPPSKRAVVAAVGGVVVVVGGLLTLLWLLVDGGSPQAPTQLELVRTGLTVLLGTGGLFGLYLAWRRQRSTEIALQQKERDQADVARAYELQRETAETNRHDAEARRITELYTKAVEQLGSDKAPVRLGGLYALERLAQDHVEQRQTIVNVLCAYLRMPYVPPDNPPVLDDTDDQLVDAHRERTQEREVRLAAQRILTNHLRARDRRGNKPQSFWADIDLDLTGATLIDFTLDGCAARRAVFARATFNGDAVFDRTAFSDDAVFSRATFTDNVRLGVVNFARAAAFKATVFRGDVWFNGTRFTGDAVFSASIFSGATHFDQVSLPGSVDGSRSPYLGLAAFDDNPATYFDGARFERGIPPEVEPFLPRREQPNDDRQTG